MPPPVLFACSALLCVLGVLAIGLMVAWTCTSFFRGYTNALIALSRGF